MKHFLLSVVCAVALCVAGCKSGGNVISPLIVQQGVASSVSYAAAKYTNAVPFIRAATPVICSVAAGTNLAPADVIRAVELSNANALKTPEGVLVLNLGLLLYTGVWQSYGSNAVANAPTLRLYLQATCDGLNEAVLPASRGKPAYEWPHVAFP